MKSKEMSMEELRAGWVASASATQYSKHGFDAEEHAALQSRVERLQDRLKKSQAEQLEEEEASSAAR
jgi:site-specific DNA-adenine methylase